MIRFENIIRNKMLTKFSQSIICEQPQWEMEGILFMPSVLSQACIVFRFLSGLPVHVLLLWILATWDNVREGRHQREGQRAAAGTSLYLESILWISTKRFDWIEICRIFWTFDAKYASNICFFSSNNESHEFDKWNVVYFLNQNWNWRINQP